MNGDNEGRVDYRFNGLMRSLPSVQLGDENLNAFPISSETAIYFLEYALNFRVIITTLFYGLNANLNDQQMLKKFTKIIINKNERFSKSEVKFPDSKTNRASSLLNTDWRERKGKVAMRYKKALLTLLEGGKKLFIC